MSSASPEQFSTAEPLLRRVARRVNLGVYLTRCAGAVAAVVIAFGLCYLFAQLLAPSLARYTFWILLAIPVALVWAWVDCRKRGRFFSGPEIVAVTDRLSHADGRATTAYERPALTGGASTWHDLAARADFRPLRLNPGYFAWRLVPAFAFAGAVFLVPPRDPKPGTDLQMMASLTQPLEEKLKVTAEILPEAERKKLEEQLEQLQAGDKEVSRENWEAVEEVQQQLENALNQSDAATQQLSKSLGEMANLISQQNGANSQQESAALQNKIDELSNSIDNLGKFGGLPMSKDFKEKLAKAMGQCRGGNCSGRTLSDLQGQCNALADKLAKQMKQGNGAKNYGKGGIDRGRADAPMVLGEQQGVDNAKFDPSQLQNQYFDESSLSDMGITTVEPKTDPGVFQPGTVKQFSAQEGSNVSRTQISPGQRGVVSRYFE